MTARHSLHYGDPEAANLDYESQTLKYCVFCDVWVSEGAWDAAHMSVRDHDLDIERLAIAAFQDGEAWVLDEDEAHGLEIVDDGYRD